MVSIDRDGRMVRPRPAEVSHHFESGRRGEFRSSKRCCRYDRVVVAAALSVAGGCVASASSTTGTTVGTTTATAVSTTSTAAVVPGPELPGGGHVLFPGRRLVAIYGHPGDGNLGVLGEQPVDAAVQRARDIAAGYSGVSPELVVPTFEIITTVASAEAGTDGDYSLESSIDHIRPWVDAAAAAGFYVVLDLQPGYTDFLTQAMRYEELLAQPHVGLALDPEWRLAPGERHMRDIGQVSADEVNRVASWLADLTRRHHLPQKLLLLHQFRLDMLPDRANIHVEPEARPRRPDGRPGPPRGQARYVGCDHSGWPGGDALRLEELLRRGLSTALARRHRVTRTVAAVHLVPVTSDTRRRISKGHRQSSRQ